MKPSIPKNKTNNNTNSIPSPVHSQTESKRLYKQIYRKDWEKVQLFKDWLSPVARDKFKAKCIACNREMLAHRLSLLKHASSAKHLKKYDLFCNPAAKKIQSNNSVTEERNNVIETEARELITKETSQDDGNNAVNIFQNLVDLTDDEAQLPQLTAQDVATTTISLETGVSEILPGMPVTPQAISFNPGYVTKNNTPQTIVCTATLINNKTIEPVTPSVANKTTCPLQVSTRVTDYSRGISVANLTVTLYMLTGGRWESMGQSVTNDVGRCDLYHKNGICFSIGLYKLHYDVGAYFEQQNLESYFPFIEISFQIKGLRETHHVPLMISPNGYTAYRSMDQ
ncbi:uncharacterized protein LOC135845843 [Planococcus citri]|uniref:uncharacterized protein LOC135845843 n=1 Tax=Planococcus citri TaxID=170843 RepID=UPI0031F91A85